jgi:hypothetical protein
VGSVKLDYIATASDIGRSSIWLVQIRAQGTPAGVPTATQPMLLTQNPPRAQLDDQLAVVASGLISVTHPAGDLNRVRSELAARYSVRAPVAPANTVAQQLLEQRKAQSQQTVAAAQASQAQQLAKLRPVAPNQAGGARSPINAQRGSNNSPPPPPSHPPPTISSLSFSYGQPGDWVGVYGSAFDGGDATYDVHFVASPTVDAAVRVLVSGFSGFGSSGCFNCGFAEVQVPAITGVAQAYDGQVYIARSGQKSAPVPFHFSPTIDLAQLAPQCNEPDSQINTNDFGCPFKGGGVIIPYTPNPSEAMMVVHNGLEDLGGHKAEDRFYLLTILKNGWVVDSVAIVAHTNGNGANAYVVDSRVGTNSPYVDVHWWTDAMSLVEYNVVVNIKGPKGVPYR